MLSSPGGGEIKTKVSPACSVVITEVAACVIVASSPSTKMPVGAGRACVIVASSPSTYRHLGALRNAELMELPVLSNLAWTRSPGTRSRQAHVFCSSSLEMDRWTHQYLMGS